MEQEPVVYTITFQVANTKNPEWEETEYESPDDAINFLVSELRYRLGHIPGGQILEIGYS